MPCFEWVCLPLDIPHQLGNGVDLPYQVFFAKSTVRPGRPGARIGCRRSSPKQFARLSRKGQLPHERASQCLAGWLRPAQVWIAADNLPRPSVTMLPTRRIDRQLSSACRYRPDSHGRSSSAALPDQAERRGLAAHRSRWLQRPGWPASICSQACVRLLCDRRQAGAHGRGAPLECG